MGREWYLHVYLHQTGSQQYLDLRPDFKPCHRYYDQVLNHLTNNKCSCELIPVSHPLHTYSNRKKKKSYLGKKCFCRGLQISCSQSLCPFQAHGQCLWVRYLAKGFLRSVLKVFRHLPLLRSFSVFIKPVRNCCSMYNKCQNVQTCSCSSVLLAP